MNIRLDLLVFFFVIGLIVGLSPMAAADTGQGSETLDMEPEDIDADEVRIDISIQEDGSAEWRIEFWVQLGDEDSSDAFESLRSDIENDPDAYTQEFADRIDGTVTTASDTTNREMEADSFSVNTERQSLAREYGVVRYTFQWHGFSSTENGELHVGDAIEGIYLDEGTQLLISWPEEYELSAVSPDPDDQRDRAVIWHGGQTNFVSGEPQVVVSPVGISLSWPIVTGTIGVLGVITVGAFWWWRTRSSRADGEPTGDSPKPVTDPKPGSTSTDESLLSNEEQVMQLLEANGGRTKQKRVVEELGWTDAKTSKVVSKLRDEGEIESFRIGRENVLTVPEEDTKKASQNE